MATVVHLGGISLEVPPRCLADVESRYLKQDATLRVTTPMTVVLTPPIVVCKLEEERTEREKK